MTPGRGDAVEESLWKSPIIRRALASGYLNERGDWWPGIEPRLFPDPRGREFGFGGLGYITEDDQERSYHVPLIGGRQYEAALTVHVFAFALECQVHDQMQSAATDNRAQYLSFMTRAPSGEMYGHAMTGDVFPDFRRWLASLGKRSDKDTVLERVEAVIAQTYIRFVSREHRSYVKDQCYARVHENGRFILGCPGNACDIAIYPDHDYGADHLDMSSKFSCHNLDDATQQLALLAGLAVLHELAVEELG